MARIGRSDSLFGGNPLHMNWPMKAFRLVTLYPTPTTKLAPGLIKRPVGFKGALTPNPILVVILLVSAFSWAPMSPAHAPAISNASKAVLSDIAILDSPGVGKTQI